MVARDGSIRFVTVKDGLMSKNKPEWAEGWEIRRYLWVYMMMSSGKDERRIHKETYHACGRMKARKNGTLEKIKPENRCSYPNGSDGIAYVVCTFLKTMTSPRIAKNHRPARSLSYN